MSRRYPLWSAPSDMDYDAPDLNDPVEASVECVQCHRSFLVRQDERPPYRCDRCCQHNAELDQRKADRRSA